jgi:hypothetical protein
MCVRLRQVQEEFYLMEESPAEAAAEGAQEQHPSGVRHRLTAAVSGPPLPPRFCAALLCSQPCLRWRACTRWSESLSHVWLVVAVFAFDPHGLGR